MHQSFRIYLHIPFDVHRIIAVFFKYKYIILYYRLFAWTYINHMISIMPYRFSEVTYESSRQEPPSSTFSIASFSLIAHDVLYEQNKLFGFCIKKINLVVTIESRPFGFESYHIWWSQNSIAIEIFFCWLFRLRLFLSLLLHICKTKRKKRALNTLTLVFTICAVENVFLHALIAHYIPKNSSNELYVYMWICVVYTVHFIVYRSI